MKVNEVLTEAGMIDNLVANVKSLMTKDPRLAQMTTDQKVQYFLRQPGMQKASDLARQVWEKRLMAVMTANQAAGRGLTAVSDQEYLKMLNDFVEKSLINAKIGDLDNDNQQRVKSAVTNVLTAKGQDDQRAMDAAFDDLISVATVARVVDTSVQPQPQPQTSNRAPTTGRGDMSTDVASLIQQSVNLTPRQIQNLGTLLQQQAGTRDVRGTGNATVDDLLKTLGFRVR